MGRLRTGLLTGLILTATLGGSSLCGFPTGQAAPGAVASQGTLVLYDQSGPWGVLGEMYAEQVANLVSHFGPWQAMPATQYQAGAMRAFAALVYIGSSYDEPLPSALLADIRSGARPVLWMGDNIWQLTRPDPNFRKAMGWLPTGFDRSPLAGVRYKTRLLERDRKNLRGIMGLTLTDPSKAQLLASAVRTDGTTLPWAVRSGRLTYLSEVPFAYADQNDRYLIFADLLFDLLAPDTPTRHRALVRIEDVGPDSDPATLVATADLLFARKVPFAVAVFPAYRDPLGVHHHKVPTRFDLRERPKVVAALKYMQRKGGTLLMHGFTHQYGASKNPYSGLSVEDTEFYRAHVDANNSVIFDGPVAEDSQAWAGHRLSASAKAFRAAGLVPPAIFVTPHYAASVPAYQAINQTLGIRYGRGSYYPGLLSGRAPDYGRVNQQFFPYLVRDIYGSLVIPENLGHVAPRPFNNNATRLPADILATAANNLLVRDGYASFFYHPTLGLSMLRTLVDGLQAQGWVFVTPDSVYAEQGRAIKHLD